MEDNGYLTAEYAVLRVHGRLRGASHSALESTAVIWKHHLKFTVWLSRPTPGYAFFVAWLSEQASHSLYV